MHDSPAPQGLPDPLLPAAPDDEEVDPHQRAQAVQDPVQAELLLPAPLLLERLRIEEILCAAERLRLYVL